MNLGYVCFVCVVDLSPLDNYGVLFCGCCCCRFVWTQKSRDNIFLQILHSMFEIRINKLNLHKLPPTAKRIAPDAIAEVVAPATTASPTVECVKLGQHAIFEMNRRNPTGEKNKPIRFK